MSGPFVTVFGGSGFLGRHALRALARAGYRLRVAVRLPHAASFLSTIGEVGQIQFMVANVRSEKAVADAVRGAHAVVNLVGPARPWGGEGYKALHLEGASHVARAAMDADVKCLVHMSLLGASLESPLARERVRARGEFAVRDRFPAATILRSARAFGPDDRLFNRAAARARLLPAMLLPGRGARRLQPVYAGDIAVAILRAIDNPSLARGRTYELAGPDIFSEKELAAFVLRETCRERRLIGLPGKPGPAEIMRKGALSFADLGITPAPITPIVGTYLQRFRPRGQYETISSRPLRHAATSQAGVIPSGEGGIDPSSWTGRN